MFLFQNCRHSICCSINTVASASAEEYITIYCHIEFFEHSPSSLYTLVHYIHVHYVHLFTMYTCSLCTLYTNLFTIQTCSLYTNLFTMYTCSLYTNLFTIYTCSLCTNLFAIYTCSPCTLVHYIYTCSLNHYIGNEGTSTAQPRTSPFSVELSTQKPILSL